MKGIETGLFFLPALHPVLYIIFIKSLNTMKNYKVFPIKGDKSC